MNFKKVAEKLNLTEGKIGVNQSGTYDFALNPNEDCGYTLSWQACYKIEQAGLADQIAEPKIRERVKVFARHYGENLTRKAAREAEIAEKQRQAEVEREKREAELRQKQEDELRRTIRMANPGISDAEVESLLPEMRREAQKQRVKAVLIQQQRSAGRKF